MADPHEVAIVVTDTVQAEAYSDAVFIADHAVARSLRHRLREPDQQVTYSHVLGSVSIRHITNQ